MKTNKKILFLKKFITTIIVIARSSNDEAISQNSVGLPRRMLAPRNDEKFINQTNLLSLFFNKKTTPFFTGLP